MTTAYLAAGWFTPAQQQLIQAATAHLAANPSLDWARSFKPAEHHYRDWSEATHPDLFADPAWQQGTFAADIHGINATDCVIALLSPDADPGTLWEMGYAYGCHKPVVLVTGQSTPLNLMPAIGATAIVDLAELAGYDFGAITARPYTGKVF